MATVAMILIVWSVLAGLVCAFVAGASRRTQLVRAREPLPVWLELFEQDREPAAAPVSQPTGTPAVI